MKKFTPFVILFLLVCTTTFAQNSFPPNGNVGIGTVSPQYSLDINGTLNATNILVNGTPLNNTSSPWSTSGNTTYYNLGNVGIGTNTPGYALDVAGAINATSILVNGSPLSAPSTPWSLNGSNAFYSSGNVGIGTNTPGYALDVAGAINATSILVNGSPLSAPSTPWSLNGSDAFYSSGNVGIGTNTPGYALDVAGAINATSILVNGSPLTSGSSPWSTSGNNLFYTAGSVSIGTNSVPSGYDFAVDGNIIAEGVTVLLSENWPDFVFVNNYDLWNLYQVETYIKRHGHLPNVPSAQDIRKNGVQLGEMDATLLQKIEELTLHSIRQQKEIDSLRVINKKLTNQDNMIKQLQQRLEKLEKSN